MVVLNQLLKASIPVVQALPHIFDIYKGVPTEYVLKRAYFKTRKERPESNIHVAKDQVGVMWFGPMVPNDGETVFEVMDCFRKKFAQHQFEFYITIMMISARTIVPFMGIFYRQEDASERERALAFYSELKKLCVEGINSSVTAAWGGIPFTRTVQTFLKSITRSKQFLIQIIL